MARPISPGLKAALEYGPLLAFLAGFLLLKGQTFHILGADRSAFVVMTAIFVPLLAVSTLILWQLTGELDRMQVVTLVLVVVFGGLTVWLNDERFFKMKPTFIYLIFGALLFFGLWRGRSYLEYALGKKLPLKAEGWMILTRRIAWFFLALAVANEVIWRSQTTGVWVSFKTIGLPIAMLGFFITQGGLLRRYGEDEPK